MKRKLFKFLRVNHNFFFKEKDLIKACKNLRQNFKSKSTGRNNSGQITLRHRGGGHKKLYRIIDYKRNKFDILGQVKAIVYDPNRNVKIALIYFMDGEKRYILYPQNLFKNNYILTAKHNSTSISSGIHLTLLNIPIGCYIHNLNIHINKGGQLVRAAGTSAKILAIKDNFVIIRLPSNEIRLIHKNCKATIGILSKPLCAKKSKAGQNRWLGIRPTVRGVAMNACDHPHGGGEGRSPIGRKTPLTPWGKIALGKKTRNAKNISNCFIIKRKI